MSWNTDYNATRGRAANIRLPSGFFLTDDARTPDPVAIIPTLPPGTGVIFRHYNHPDRIELGGRLADACRAQGLSFMVAGDIALAQLLHADGFHMPEWMLKRSNAPNLRPRFLVTAAVHSLAAVRRAKAARVDAILVSPVFPTASHPGGGFLGPHKLARIAAATSLPTYALGGVEESTIRRLPPNVKGIAAIGVFLD